MTTQFIPNVGVDLDPITCTWLRGLISTAIERQLRPLCWHFEHGDNDTVATGYVTVSLLHEAPEIRRAWADALELNTVVDNQGRPASYTGTAGTLTISLPNEIDPDEHCRICNKPIDPRSNDGDEVCRSCATAGDYPSA